VSQKPVDQAPASPPVVPLLDLHAQFGAVESDVRSAIDRVLATQQFILGAEVAALEEEIAGWLGAAHAVGVSSGTDALLVALMALGIGPGDEVVTTPFSFFATAGVIARVGARPVFADIDPTTFNIDASQAAERRTARTRAIMPVHLFGCMAELDLLHDAAAAGEFAIIEDAAQAIGSRDEQGRLAGTTGEFGCFSFFPSKNLGCAGDGGLVTTNSDALAERIRALRVHGSRRKYLHPYVGGNFRLDALQAAILRAKLPHVDSWTKARRSNARRYRVGFGEAGLGDLVKLPEDVPGHCYNQFVIRVPRRDALHSYLAKHGVGSEIYYPVPLHLQECFAHLGYAEGAFPYAESAAHEVLALPIFPELEPSQQERVIELIARFFA
jgi:dTDP-4-amino-4,6-dideoxygalactose transaminase